MFDEVFKKKLRWRCRRGMLELDLLLGPFLEEAFDDLDASDQQTFVGLLDEDDPDLLSWFSRKTCPCDPAFAAMVETILARIQPA
jgi:antitoxin CptB|tara:strand:- start:319 stop:573 length:255 start_codon:yes stop_codon:yes gene_type:complete